MSSDSAAAAYFIARLRHESDPSDVQLALQDPNLPLVAVDPRGESAFKEGHIPGALSMPHRQIDADSVHGLDRDADYVTYGWGPGCNAGTKSAAKLAALGFRVKEMIGGIEYWRKEGYQVDEGM